MDARTLGTKLYTNYLCNNFIKQVIVDDKGTADCNGEITYTWGDIGLGYCSYKKAQSVRNFSRRFLKTSKNPRLACGYFTCTGSLNLVCDGMLSGCHGDA